MRRNHAVALLVGLLTALALTACGGQPALTGTDLGEKPAIDFTLTDQRGQTVQLSQLRGNAVALTFIYTNCTDVCPLIAEHLRAAYDQLPSKTRDRVELVAVTVDPARDTPEALQAFSEKHGVANNPRWHAVTGSTEELAKVWSAYYIDPGAMIAEDQPHDDHAHADGTPDAGGTLAHTDAIYLLDAQGNLRVLMRSDDNPKAVARNLEALAR